MLIKHICICFAFLHGLYHFSSYIEVHAASYAGHQSSARAIGYKFPQTSSRTSEDSLDFSHTLIYL